MIYTPTAPGIAGVFHSSQRFHECHITQNDVAATLKDGTKITFMTVRDTPDSPERYILHHQDYTGAKVKYTGDSAELAPLIVKLTGGKINDTLRIKT